MPSQTSRAQKSVRWHLRAVGFTTVLLIGGVASMAATIDLSGAVVASGNMVVESDVKKVQHPTGGVVASLLVENGSHVKTGDLLIRLDDTIARSNLDTVEHAMQELTARRARLEAERDGRSAPEFAPDLLAAAGDPQVERIVTGESRLFVIRREAVQDQKVQLRGEVDQLDQQIHGLEDQLAAKRQELALVGQELAGVRDLFGKKLIPLTRLVALEREAARMQGERGLLLATIAQSKGKISETKLKIVQVDENLRSDVAKDLADIRAKYSELIDKKVTALDQVRRIDIRAPRDGFVHELATHTKGGVISPGEQIMLIIPDSDALVVEVHVTPQDINQVRMDQPVSLRFPSFNQRTTPNLKGMITRIAANTTEDPRTGNAYFVVRIGLTPEDRRWLTGKKLVPGMPVDAFIQTTTRPMLSYLLAPIIDQAKRAFRESDT